uniref:Uncharacterized protein n=1 Tax=Lutzomyia longipalpis TaxID=7200 RepID=A0A1B0CIV4_LUTLO
MEEDVLNALQSRSAFLPGGRDRDNNLLLVIPVPFELHPWTKPYLETSINDETKSCGFTVLIDAQKCSWRLAKIHMRATTLLGANLSTLIVIRPDAFWDKQRVENCARINKTGEMQQCCHSTPAQYSKAGVQPLSHQCCFGRSLDPISSANFIKEV